MLFVTLGKLEVSAAVGHGGSTVTGDHGDLGASATASELLSLLTYKKFLTLIS